MQIKKIKIDGFRSLKNCLITKCENLNVFHGLNNSGKSNTLAFLEILFRRKLQEPELTGRTAVVSEREEPESRLVNFWNGKIEGFRDNFFKNETDYINFTIEVQLSPAPKKYPDLFQTIITENKNNNVTFEGIIKKISNDEASFSVTNITLNNKTIFKLNLENNTRQYIPHLKKEESLKVDAVDKFLTQFNNAVKVISSRRFIAEEQEIATKIKIDDATSTPDKFKNWLFGLSLDREKYDTFQKIKTWFNADPFKYGNISFARIGDNIEILIEKGDLVLPISRLGSGVQQLLILISDIADCKSKIIGIEEFELNLSPSLQQQLLKNLRTFVKSGDTPITQMFLTSHSERFYDIPEINKYFVQMNHDGITKIKTWSDEHKIELTGGLWETD